MKFTRSTYPLIAAMIIFFLIRETIKQFSEKLAEQIFFPTLIIFILLFLIGIIFIIIDKEFFVQIITDERTKRVDRSAGYYSWWFTLIFAYIHGFIAYVKNFTLNQFIFVLISEMFITMLIFHMFFNFKGEF